MVVHNITYLSLLIFAHIQVYSIAIYSLYVPRKLSPFNENTLEVLQKFHHKNFVSF